jgi:ParB family transcriptional regulator, chromosome partitioning protein
VAKPKPGMGRGLGAILSVSTEGAKEGEDLRELPVELISPNPNQPRRQFDEDALQALAGSLGQQGVLQPVLVRPRPGGTYELVAGERRWRAAQIAGLATIPALIREREDAAALEVALIENMARADLSPIEEARACAALVEELGLTREEVGLRVGRSRVAVSNLVRLLDLPDETIELLQKGTLSAGHGRALLMAEDHASRRALARSAAEQGWSVRVTEERARQSTAGKRDEQGLPARRTRISARIHPDQEQAAKDIADALGDALGAEVKVTPTPGGGYRAEMAFASAEDALDLADRIRPGVAA